MELPIPNDIAFIGEIGLGGELRTVSIPSCGGWHGYLTFMVIF